MMKNIIISKTPKYCIGMLFLLLSLAQLQAQRLESKRLFEAKKYRSGIDCDVDPQKAYKIYLSLINEGSAGAMDALGTMFLNGEGVTQDYTTAMQYFKQAADLGYPQAAFHLGFMYQKGYGVKQDFSQAYEYFDIAAQAGNNNGYYRAGYLVYKGFGVPQNYEKAINYFEKGALLNDNNCEYMLALYYLTGHDDKPDFEKGKQLLYRALKHGHPWMEDFTKNNTVDSLQKVALSDQKKWTDVKKGRLTRQMRKFDNNASDSVLQGKWIGRLYTYDWSKTKIEKEQSIRLNFKTENAKLNLQWYDNDSLITIYSAERAGAKFTATVSRQIEINPRSKWVISDVDFDIDNSKKVLFANLQQYDIATREPMYHTMAVLEKVPDDPIIITSIYPNPFDNMIKVDFDTQVAQKIKPEIYNSAGIKVYSSSKIAYLKGHNSLSIVLNLPQGTYTLYLKGDNYICSQNIIKN